MIELHSPLVVLMHLVAAKRGELESRAIRYPVDILEEKEIRDLEKQDRRLRWTPRPTCNISGVNFCGPKTAAMSLARERPPT